MRCRGRASALPLLLLQLLGSLELAAGVAHSLPPRAPRTVPHAKAVAPPPAAAAASEAATAADAAAADAAAAAAATSIAPPLSALEGPHASSSSRPVPLPPAETLPSRAGLSGVDLVSSPNVFRGVSPDGKMTNAPLPLTREEEAALIPRALFFIASADATRTLQAAAALEAVLEASEEAAEHGLGEEPDYDDPVPSAAISHEDILEEMQRMACERHSGTGEICPPDDKEATWSAAETAHGLSEVEFRYQVALGRGAYNKLFLHNQRLVCFEVNKVPHSCTAVPS